VHKAPKTKDKPMQASPATMEEVVERLDASLDAVAANRGAPGPDRRTIGVVQAHWPSIRSKLSAALLDGTYQPGDIRRAWIPKTGGGERGLGIPNVVDRVVQEAVRRTLEPLHEPTFHPSSHGFRPNRSCHTAIAEAKSYVAEGHEWVVDLDLEAFFDRVHHQRLMSRLAQRVHDKGLLILVGRMLKAHVVMPDGVRVRTDEGVPQGGPLSPLLSNIVLSELDAELAERGLRFVRYADDVNIYVRSERAGRRVMESISRFIEKRLRLKVNGKKSAVAKTGTRHFLGFRLQSVQDATPQILLSERSERRLRDRIRELTRRNQGQSLRVTIAQVNEYLTGWCGFFGICSTGIERFLRGTDAHIRRRLRAIVLHHWKTKRTTARRLIRLGVRRETAWRRVYLGRRAKWTLSHDVAIERGLPNAYFAERGLSSLALHFRGLWAEPVAPRQLGLPWDTARS
jgi:group II intron reverse transcriptase/maturase